MGAAHARRPPIVMGAARSVNTLNREERQESPRTGLQFGASSLSWSRGPRSSCRPRSGPDGRRRGVGGGSMGDALGSTSLGHVAHLPQARARPYSGTSTVSKWSSGWATPHRACRTLQLPSQAVVPDFARRSRSWIEAALRAGRRSDVGFQPTPVAMRYPSPLRRTGIPYVLGPVGGGLESPPGFVGEDTAPWYVDLRAMDAARLRWDRWLRRSYLRARVVLVIAPYAEKALRQYLPLDDVRVMSETALAQLPPSGRHVLGHGRSACCTSAV